MKRKDNNIIAKYLDINKNFKLLSEPYLLKKAVKTNLTKKLTRTRKCRTNLESSSSLHNFEIKYPQYLTLNMLSSTKMSPQKYKVENLTYVVLQFVGDYLKCALIVNVLYIIFPSKSVFEIQFMESLIFNTRNMLFAKITYND